MRLSSLLLFLACLAAHPATAQSLADFERDRTGDGKAAPFTRLPIDPETGRLMTEWLAAAPAPPGALGSPESACSISGVRLGGQPGDAYIGPTCNTDGTYRTCFYVQGLELPGQNPSYQLLLDGVSYPIAFTVALDATQVVLCATGLPAGPRAVDVSVQLAVGCSFVAANLYDAPLSCAAPGCMITDIRLGGQPGDAFIGPTCNNDSTYRTCFYVTGENVPASSSEAMVVLDGVEYPIAFRQTLSATQTVVCVTGLPSGVRGVDVFIQLAAGCNAIVPNLYDAPAGCPSPGCAITGVRLGGQPGDAYIGPTCNTDGSYRTCFYVSGVELPPVIPDTMIMLDGLSYPIAFSVQLSPSEVVLCATNLPVGALGVDVAVQMQVGCTYSAPDLYDAPSTCQVSCSISNARLGGQPGDAYIGPTCNSDGTYRTCFYVSGAGLSSTAANYTLQVDGVQYPIAFFQALSTTEVVLCATGLPAGRIAIDVTVQVATGCTLTASDLYDAPSGCPGGCMITNVRLGGRPGDLYYGPTCSTDGTYRTCFYVSGIDLPSSESAYTVTIDGAPYPATLAQAAGSGQVVLCVSGLPTGPKGVDVFVQTPECSFTATNLYDTRDDCSPEGCSPAYWRQPEHFDSWVAPYEPKTSFVAVFGPLPGFKASLTLLGALRTEGAGRAAILPHGVAALLNAQGKINYPLAPIEVITLMQQALSPGGDADGTRTLFEGLNGAFCPLN